MAVFRDGQLAWARAWGLRDAAVGGTVDTSTLFQAASISKPVTALGAMLLSEDGRLALDADIGQAVTGWQALAPITPRQLLSHTAGLSVSGFPGYAAGQPVPTTAQVLAGGPPANTPAVRVDGPVGQQARYSGGGYLLLQALMTERAGLPFAAWMQSAVLGPLAMGRSSFQQPLQGQAALNAASGHRQGRPLLGRWHAYPELAAAGLWTTPSDLGRVAAALQDSLAARPAPLLIPATVRQMLTPQPGGYGLGWVLETRAGEPVFGHPVRGDKPPYRPGVLSGRLGRPAQPGTRRQWRRSAPVAGGLAAGRRCRRGPTAARPHEGLEQRPGFQPECRAPLNADRGAASRPA